MTEPTAIVRLTRNEIVALRTCIMFVSEGSDWGKWRLWRDAGKADAKLVTAFNETLQGDNG